MLKRRSFAAVEAEAVVAGPVAVVVGSLTVGLHGLIDHLEVGVDLALLLIGLDAGFADKLESAIAKNVYPDLCGTRELQQLVLDGLATGKTGQAAGQGLYDWSQKDADDFRRRKQSPYFAGVKEWAMPDVK